MVGTREQGGRRRAGTKRTVRDQVAQPNETRTLFVARRCDERTAVVRRGLCRWRAHHTKPVHPAGATVCLRARGATVVARNTTDARGARVLVCRSCDDGNSECRLGRPSRGHFAMGGVRRERRHRRAVLCNRARSDWPQVSFGHRPILGLVVAVSIRGGAPAHTATLFLIFAMGASASLARGLFAGGHMLGVLRRHQEADAEDALIKAFAPAAVGAQPRKIIATCEVQG